MFKKAASMQRLSHYQIINHKLYRNPEEVFPFRYILFSLTSFDTINVLFRNKGVEHFILKIINKLPDMEFILNTHDWPYGNKWSNNIFPIFSFSKVVSILS
jgi:EGF-domain serine glucosyl/xylosyltransferase